MNKSTLKVTAGVVSLTGAMPVFAHDGLPHDGLTHQLLHLLESHTLLLAGALIMLVGGLVAWQKITRRPATPRRSR